MSDTPSPPSRPAIEYAPELTTRERLRWLLMLGAPVAALLAALEFVGFPWLRNWLPGHDCTRLFGLDVDVLVLYGLVCGPLLAIVLVAVPVLLWRGIRIVRTGQAPPPGVKVWQRTPVLRGRPARRRGYFRIAQFVALLGALALCFVLVSSVLDVLHRLNPERCAVPFSRTI